MSLDRSEAALEKLERSSRRAAVGTALGLLIVISSLAFSAARLSRLQDEERQLRTTNVELQAANSRAIEEATVIKGEVTDLRLRVSSLQCALTSSRAAISAFHARAYDVAVRLYDEALRCDAGNAYILDLKAYSQFKLGQLNAAIQTAYASVEADSQYAWGYFDLSRFLCAARRPSEAETAARRALGLRAELRAVMRSDGEFVRLCGAQTAFFRDLLR